MTPHIGIVPLFDDDPLQFEVTIRDATGASRHRISVSRADVARLGAGADAESVVVASCRFLLDREPKESILSCFDIKMISGYFPDFETRLAGYLAAGK